MKVIHIHDRMRTCNHHSIRMKFGHLLSNLPVSIDCFRNDPSIRTTHISYDQWRMRNSECGNNRHDNFLFQVLGYLTCKAGIIENKLDVGLKAGSSCKFLNLFKKERSSILSFYSKTLHLTDGEINFVVYVHRIHAVLLRNRIGHQKTTSDSK